MLTGPANSFMPAPGLLPLFYSFKKNVPSLVKQTVDYVSAYKTVVKGNRGFKS